MFYLIVHKEHVRHGSTSISLVTWGNVQAYLLAQQFWYVGIGWWSALLLLSS